MQICRPFAQTGFCRYGKRCRFIHPDPEATTNSPFQQPLQDQLAKINPSTAYLPALPRISLNDLPAQGIPDTLVSSNVPPIATQIPHYTAANVHQHGETMADLQHKLMPYHASTAQLSLDMDPRQSSFLPHQRGGIAGLQTFHHVAERFSQVGHQPVAPVSPTVLGSGYHNTSQWLDGDKHQHACQTHPSPKSVLDYPSSCNHDEVSARCRSLQVSMSAQVCISVCCLDHT